MMFGFLFGVLISFFVDFLYLYFIYPALFDGAVRNPDIGLKKWLRCFYLSLALAGTGLLFGSPLTTPIYLGAIAGQFLIAAIQEFNEG
ncbi:hypothetical protein K9N68_37600 (plasmid) [Kovacikia minuta CCNUW1]|uniref:hypothetical protein n=1 Tax=Kovacikia minuta TaxID=2931930 RepID=UPI001CCBBC0D|nr:hypothetical protein [Kovacikia minuta]UBF29929.1 hypothetical protein K9N68_37600 [Kovacikia minuta CCNUW1]